MLKRLAHLIDPELHEGPGLTWVNQFVLIVILVSTFVGILETEPVLRDRFGTWFILAEAGFFVIFSAEYLLRLLVARYSPRYRSAWGFARSPAAMIDLAVILSMFAPFLGLQMNALRLVRALRIVRLARLGRFSIAIRLLGDAIASRGPEIAVSVIFAGMLLLFSSAGLYLLEGGLQPDDFGSIPRAMWWSVATLTTVGYGDAVPVTGFGRFFAALTALTGIGIIAVPTGLMAGAFTEALHQTRDRKDKDLARPATVEVKETDDNGADGA
ncbi:MAG: ion transporter [Rubellimicrobium sp.]|nr:ion transporter [Rubellimicrobium sp.]